MKKIFIYSLFIVLAFAFTSCQDPVQQLAGTYSYKISGQVIVQNDSTANKDTLTLADEMGAMDLIRIDSTTAMVTFNVLRGPVYKTQAQIHGKQIILENYKRTLSIGLLDYAITASGKGTMYDNTLIMDLTYEGDKLSTDEILLVCKKN